jgi:hypothetical protein
MVKDFLDLLKSVAEPKQELPESFNFDPARTGTGAVSSL